MGVMDGWFQGVSAACVDQLMGLRCWRAGGQVENMKWGKHCLAQVPPQMLHLMR